LAQTALHSGIIHERPDFGHRKKKQQKTERGEFITVKKLVNATFMHCSMFISVESCVTLLFISQTIGFDVILAPVADSNMLNTMNITIRN
jgi:hypothetical protein